MRNVTFDAKVKERIDDLENEKLFKKSSSPWASLIPLVPKAGKDHTQVANYRRIHESIAGNA